MCALGVAGAEVDGVDASSREVCDVRPCLLRLDAACSRLDERLDQRALGDDSAGGESPDTSISARPSTSSRGRTARLPGVRSGAYRKLTVATARSGMTLSAIPASKRVTLSTSRKVSPPTTTSRGSSSIMGFNPSSARSMALSACHGRAEWPLTPRNERRALMWPRQPACTSPSVGSSTIARAASWIALRALEESRERVVLRWELLAAEEEQRDVVEAGLGSR